MHVIRATGIAAVAIVAGLYLVLARNPDDMRVKPPRPASISSIEIEAQSRTRNTSTRVDLPADDASRKTPPVNMRPVSGEQIDSADSPARGPNTDASWPRLLYPELATIIESESLPADSALHNLQPLLANSDPVIRLAALESIANTNHPARLPALLAALDDPNPQIRVAALEAFTLQGDRSAAGVIGSLVYDQDPDVRIAAIDALAALADPGSVHVLAALLYDPNHEVRVSAVAALGEIGGDDAIIYLRQVRYDPDDSIRVSANAILLEAGREMND